MAKKKSSNIPEEVSAYMAKIGARGGANGKGVAKKRTPKQYRKMERARLRNRDWDEV
jgi:hypothetical protein